MTRWVVLFSREGVDTLIPVDPLRNEDVLRGKPSNLLNKALISALLRCLHGNLSGAEVWSYTASEDFPDDYDDMLRLWQEMPQTMADLVRSKGKRLARNWSSGYKQKIK